MTARSQLDSAADRPLTAATGQIRRKRGTRWLSAAGAVVGLGALGWVLAGLDYAVLGATVSRAEPAYVAILAAATALEQLVRAWKWRQILLPLHPVGTPRLFGAIMAGYLANFLVPLGVSPFIRSWLVARLESIRMSAVLAGVAIDRSIDGLVFGALVLGVVILGAIPDPSGDVRAVLVAGGAASLVLIGLAVALMWRHKRQMGMEVGWLLSLAGRLPHRLRVRTRALLISFADGIVWPRQGWRRAGIVAAAVAAKLIAAAHLLWAGLAFDTVLTPGAYLVLLAMLGFLAILTHLARVPGGFIVGGVYALGLFGVGAEVAVLMMGTLVATSMAVIGVTGAWALWRHGIALAELKAREVRSDGTA